MSQQGAPKMPPQPLYWAGWDNVGIPEECTAEEFADALDFAEHWDVGVLWVKQSYYTSKKES